MTEIVYCPAAPHVRGSVSHCAACRKNWTPPPIRKYPPGTPASERLAGGPRPQVTVAAQAANAPRPDATVTFNFYDFIALWQCPTCGEVTNREEFCSHIGREAHEHPGCNTVRAVFYPGFPARDDGRDPSASGPSEHAASPEPDRAPYVAVDPARARREADGGETFAAAAVHHLHTPADGELASRFFALAHDVNRPAPLRAGVHHLHANRQRAPEPRGASGYL